MDIEASGPSDEIKKSDVTVFLDVKYNISRTSGIILLSGNFLYRI